MTNSGHFWGKTDEGRVKSKKVKSDRFKGWGSIIIKKIVLLFDVIRQFFGRLIKIPRVLNRVDKIAVISLLIIFVALLGYKLNRDLLAKTKKVAAVGGKYEEILIGEANYLNPILAKSDADRTINQVIYSGLTKIGVDGQIKPDLAEKYEVSADGKIYTFHLNRGIIWHDGSPFSSADIANTISEVKDSSIKSPYFDSWKDVEVETPDENTVVFKLANPYGPFIFNTLIKIIPGHLNSASLSASPVGTGPYKFSKVSSRNNQISEVYLERFDAYYGQKPYIKTLQFKMSKDEANAKKSFASVDAISGVKINDEDVTNHSYSTSRFFGIVFNLNNEKFKDINLRKKIKSNEKFEPEISCKLLTLDKPLSVSAAENLSKEYSIRGIKLVLDKKGAIEYQAALEKKNFETVFYGFDFGYDRDPYPFWHSSQISGGMNYSGFADKKADILLEDARMMTDSTARNQKYDQFFQILSDQAVAIFLPPEAENFSIKNRIKGVNEIKGFEPWDHLNSISGWYIKTKRVKP